MDATQWDLVSPGLYVHRSDSIESVKRITWSREDPPSYVWFTGDQPEWLRLTPIREVTEAVWDRMRERQTEFLRLIDLTVDNFKSAEAVVPMTETGDQPGELIPSTLVLPVSLAQPSGV